MGVYYAPANFGLETVGEISFDDEPYQFDMGVVWWHPERRVFFYATDSGCSCPSPFEDYTSLDSLGEPLDLAGLTSLLRGIGAPQDRYGRPDEPVPVQVERLLQRAKAVASRG